MAEADKTLPGLETSKHLSVWSRTAKEWVEGLVVGLEGDEDKVAILEFDLAGIGQCRKRVHLNSRSLLVNVRLLNFRLQCTKASGKRTDSSFKSRDHESSSDTSDIDEMDPEAAGLLPPRHHSEEDANLHQRARYEAHSLSRLQEQRGWAYTPRYYEDERIRANHMTPTSHMPWPDAKLVMGPDDGRPSYNTNLANSEAVRGGAEHGNGRPGRAYF